VAVSVAELRRGRIAWGLFPFAADFPLTYLDGDGEDAFQTIEDYAAARGGRATRIVTEVRLRPLLLLHDGTRGEYPDAVCLRINSVKPHHRDDSETWRRITENEHPFFFHLPAETTRYQLPQESVIALGAIGTVSKSAILSVGGYVTDDELQIVSERLVRVLSIDLAPHIAARARELLQRAGVLSEDRPG
jgi:hypothetical protein